MPEPMTPPNQQPQPPQQPTPSTPQQPQPTQQQGSPPLQQTPQPQPQQAAPPTAPTQATSTPNTPAPQQQAPAVPPQYPYQQPTSQPGNDATERLIGRMDQFIAAQQTQQVPATPPRDFDTEIAQAIDDGETARVTALMREARAADEARMRAEIATQASTIAAQQSATARHIVLRDNAYYRDDPIIRQQTDNFLQQLEAQGTPMTTTLVEAALSKVVGDNHMRLVQAEREAWARQQNDGTVPPQGQPPHQQQPGTPGAVVPGSYHPPSSNQPQPQQMTEANLSTEAQSALLHLDNGRGRSLDDFARSIPPRIVTEVVRDPTTGAAVRDNLGRVVRQRVTKSYTNGADMFNQYEASRAELQRQQQRYYGPFATPNT